MYFLVYQKRQKKRGGFPPLFLGSDAQGVRHAGAAAGKLDGFLQGQEAGNVAAVDAPGDVHRVPGALAGDGGNARAADDDVAVGGGGDGHFRVPLFIQGFCFPLPCDCIIAPLPANVNPFLKKTFSKFFSKTP